MRPLGYDQNLYHNAAAIVNNTGISWKVCTLPSTNVYGTCELFIPGDSGDVIPDLKNEDASLWAL